MGTLDYWLTIWQQGKVSEIMTKPLVIITLQLSTLVLRGGLVSISDTTLHRSSTTCTSLLLGLILVKRNVSRE
jgi:hypothetical protein